MRVNLVVVFRLLCLAILYHEQLHFRREFV